MFVMANPNPSPVVNGPEEGPVMRKTPTPPVPAIVGTIPLQSASTNGQTSQLSGQSLFTQGVAPGRYRYSTATMGGKQGVFIIPINQKGGVNKKQIFIPFRPKTAPSPQPTLLKQSDSKRPTTTPVAIIGGNMGVASTGKDLQNVYRTALPTNPSLSGFGIVVPNKTTSIRPNAPILQPSPLTSVSSRPPVVIGTGKRFPVKPVSALKTSTAGPSGTTFKLVIDQRSALSTPNSSSVMCNKPVATTSIVKTEPPDYNKPVGTLLIKQSPDKSSVCAVTYPSKDHTPPYSMSHTYANTSYTSPKTVHTYLSTSNTSISTSDTKYSTFYMTPGPSQIHTSNTCSTHTSWSSLAPVSVCEESPSIPETDNTENVPAENTLTEEDNEMPFKIDSVFSLCGSNVTTEGDFVQPENIEGELKDCPKIREHEPVRIQTQQYNPEEAGQTSKKKKSCKYNNACFPVLENLKLYGLATIDIRKFRKITGRRSCSQKCRDKTVKRYCILDKLCIKEKPVILDIPLLTDIKMEQEELQRFEVFLKTCKPAPVSKKLKLFHEFEQKWTGLTQGHIGTEIKQHIKKKKKELKIKLFSPSVNPEDEFCVFKKNKKKQHSIVEEQNKKQCNRVSLLAGTKSSSAYPEQVLSNKAISLLNPESNATPSFLPLYPNIIESQSRTNPQQLAINPQQVTTTPQREITVHGPQGDKAALQKVDKPFLDTKSPAFQKAIAGLGAKKFFLLRIEGKNIIMPVEQNSVLPRAYVLGDNVTGASSAMCTTVTRTAPPPLPVSKTTVSTKVSVKSEPPDTDYEKPVVSVHNNKPAQHQETTVRVKSEPVGRGYADETNLALTAVSEETRGSDSIINTALTTQRARQLSDSLDTNEVNMPSTSPTKSAFKPVSSADRIRKLKELLKKNEEELQIIKKRRIEESVDVSDILEDSGI